MKFRLSTLLLHSIFASLAFGLVYLYGEASPGIYVYLLISAIYSVAFALLSAWDRKVRNGAIGAAFGWGFAILIGVGIEFVTYVASDSPGPHFDGDGPVFGLIWLPLFAFLYLLLPLVIMGCVIGFMTSLARRKGTRSSQQS